MVRYVPGHWEDERRQRPSRFLRPEGMRKLLTFLLEIGLVVGGFVVLVWQFSDPTVENGWLVIGGASAVCVGLMLLYEGLANP